VGGAKDPASRRVPGAKAAGLTRESRLKPAGTMQGWRLGMMDPVARRVYPHTIRQTPLTPGTRRVVNAVLPESEPDSSSRLQPAFVVSPAALAPGTRQGA